MCPGEYVFNYVFFPATGDSVGQCNCELDVLSLIGFVYLEEGMKTVGFLR